MKASGRKANSACRDTGSPFERIAISPAEYETYLKKSLTVSKLIKFIEMGTYLTDREIEFQERILASRFLAEPT
ncbi:MAG: hypothetical protein Q9N34_08840 [Aquificota bacterium]|nr:hypothetical protein [Aquificota bacterium]